MNSQYRIFSYQTPTMKTKGRLSHTEPKKELLEIDVCLQGHEQNTNLTRNGGA